MDNQEERRVILGNIGISEVTSAGKIFTLRDNRALARCKDEYSEGVIS